mgnify:FL=1|jgi:hypothetical protein
MTDIEVTLNAWEKNYVSVLAVQGESDGRTLNVTLVDRTGQTDGTFNAESVDRPIDLTDTSVHLYCKKSDGTKTFSGGTITGAKDGKASFVLPEQATSAAGSVSAQIYITKPDNSALKVIGLTLQVESSDIEGIESTDDFLSLVEALNKADSAAEQTAQAKADSEAAVTNANTAIDNINAKNQEMTTAESARVAAESGRVNAESARASAESARQSNEQTRKTQESGRVSAESSRVTAENQRQANTQTAISNAETATANANEAADRANNAAQSVDDAIEGNLGPAIDARLTARLNVEGGMMGYDAGAALTDRVVALEDTVLSKAAWLGNAYLGNAYLYAAVG